MARLGMTTYKDAVAHLIDFLKTNQEQKATRDCKQAVQEAYRDLANAHSWSFFRKHGRINAVASQTTGTVAYDHTGGSSERLVTLSGATWPSWALYGTLRIANIDYEVASNPSSTTLTLSSQQNPGADVAAGTSYTLYRDTYTLPNDFVAMKRMALEQPFGALRYVGTSDFLQVKRAVVTTSAYPSHFTIFGSGDAYAAMAVGFYPLVGTDQTIDYYYIRRPREMSIYNHNDGTVTVTSGSATVTGSGTNFTAAMVGSVIRLSSTSATEPQALWQENPYSQERIILSYTDANTVTVDSAFTTSLSGVKYVVSDPVDIEPGVMLNPFYRCCEKHLVARRDMKDFEKREALYERVLREAKGSDKRFIEADMIGGGSIGTYYGPTSVVNA